MKPKISVSQHDHSERRKSHEQTLREKLLKYFVDHSDMCAGCNPPAPSTKEGYCYCWEQVEGLLPILRQHEAGLVRDLYPEGVFTPLTPQEKDDAIYALVSSNVRSASDRLHASWARHWANLLEKMS